MPFLALDLDPLDDDPEALDLDAFDPFEVFAGSFSGLARFGPFEDAEDALEVFVVVLDDLAAGS